MVFFRSSIFSTRCRSRIALLLSVMTAVSPLLESFLHDQYDKVFGRPWPVLPSALVIAALNVFLFAFDRPWTASDGLRNWGDSLFKMIGVIDQPDLLPPLLFSASVLNIGLLVGGLAAALLSREFAIRSAPPKEIVKGAVGGLMMGLGAMLSFGCNIGGFFSALSALSASGLTMMVGLMAGSFAATRFIIWERVRQIEKGHPLAGSSSRHKPSREINFSISFSSTRWLPDLSVTRPCFLSMRCRTLVRTSHPSGSRPWSDPGKGIISRPWQVQLPQKTVGTTPCPTVADTQIRWLSLSGVQPLFGSRRGRTRRSQPLRVVFEGRDSG
jgi:hypothetical protein